MRNASVCACGVIGSRARLRIWCRETCRFESYQAHKKKDMAVTPRFAMSFFLFIKADTGLRSRSPSVSPSPEHRFP